MFKSITIGLVAVFLVGCVSGPINLQKLNNKSNSYGIVVFRPIYFSSNENMDIFTQKGLLASDSFVFVSAWNEELSVRFKEDNYFISDQYLTNGKIASHNLYALNIKNSSGNVVGLYSQHAAYGVTMLLAGNYRMGCITMDDKSHWTGRNEYKNMPDPDSYRFDVKAGEINYIGDLYIYDPKIEKKSTFFSEAQYSSSVIIVDRNGDAAKFMKKAYQDLKLPFRVKLIKNINK